MDERALNRVNSDRLQSRQVDELIGLARGLIADGSINSARLTPNTAGAGAVTTAQPMRSMQMQIRFTF